MASPICRFCDSLAICKVSVPLGCLCFPNDREQYLCTHHYIKANPIGDMVIIEDLTVDSEFTRWVEGGCR